MAEESGVCKEELFNGIFRKYSKDLYQFLYYKFGADRNPEDLVQEAFLKLWNNCAKVPPSKARSFLFTVANNQMLNDLDRAKTALKYRNEADLRHIDKESPDYKMEESEYSDRLKAAIDSLSEEQRVAFLLNRIEDKSHKEIAEMLNISRKAVEKRIYGALKKIRKFLEKSDDEGRNPEPPPVI
ncbi:RNA polymerase sigma factor [Fulvivirga sedimenti]|uniref:RNA polymerase sigma factor n=1 Tax=Fulvivirga sedimenti TaxID=2879465 RepID=A0A9X1HUR1_9BACT|nr:RNA polymerase sigma factor [Fulvivirga sedimenti]MCA6074524.1 RNA polymerase sigma factor [Fulvivirga sedimenti]MCA6075701.1 RNA polymerase sigma factor [Fulvivirga sedimenti]MCA6076829.1 RNA polymerase sigma factor [Fulvivirga sedimenti]